MLGLKILGAGKCADRAIDGYPLKVKKIVQSSCTKLLQKLSYEGHSLCGWKVKVPEVVNR